MYFVISFTFDARYGAGMVVYWFGFVEGLNTENADGLPWDEHIIVTATVPTDLKIR